MLKPLHLGNWSGMYLPDGQNVFKPVMIPGKCGTWLAGVALAPSHALHQAHASRFIHVALSLVQHIDTPRLKTLRRGATAWSSSNLFKVGSIDCNPAALDDRRTSTASMIPCISMNCKQTFDIPEVSKHNTVQVTNSVKDDLPAVCC